MRCLPGTLLILATIISLIVANSPLGDSYHHLLSGINLFGNFNIHMLVNDFLMTIFFLLVGLEIKHEVLHGNLSSLKKASFPIIGAIGGVLVPAIIFLIFNSNTEFASGVGIPISTDIAFAIGLFMMLKNKMNPLLKIFLLSLAVVDDLISILVIGILYSSGIKYEFLIMSAIITGLLLIINKKKINKITPYMILGFILWICIYSSGIHATISGVILAMSIPSKKFINSKSSVLESLEHKLTPICNYFILPLFALVNTAISFGVSTNSNSSMTLINGIIIGLFIGKPLGIMLFTWIATKLNITEKPEGVDWWSIFAVSLLAGIGFTMSIFVSEVAFGYSAELVNISKVSILIASVMSICATYMVSTVINIYKKKSAIYINSSDTKSMA
ncbi:Na+/H+ antiporter NhaA [Romboutsia weinsteinii]|uniref:Na(+)/H(+) antiporter NhaA n=1 Tax=Romboutsia weinsteinii TaxID=2020949 RepID=A0A371J0M5_9FIRM|nr:Na+/H+ antiporter NhaA [Romboutsia weinsteinii]RDY26319.1 Na+/H+ antiporter NhaA [Romboutsia weinsteinii]